MSHDDEAAATPRGARQRGHAPLDRPSLFAEFDQGHVEDIEPQRVRLLSTLESQRGRTRRPRHKRAPSGTRGPWTTRALMAVMGLGMLIVLVSFIEVLRRPPPPLAAPKAATAARQAAPHVAAPSATTGQAQKSAPAASAALAHQAAEIIDTAPPAATWSPPTAASQPVAVAAAAARPSASSPTAALLATAAADVARLNAEPAGRKPAREAPRRETRPQSDDVALLEAMFTHSAGPGGTRQAATSGRKPASAAAQAPASVSAAEALRECGNASSADAAVCRARVCVQHPTTQACHEGAR